MGHRSLWKTYIRPFVHHEWAAGLCSILMAAVLAVGYEQMEASWSKHEISPESVRALKARYEDSVAARQAGLLPPAPVRLPQTIALADVPATSSGISVSSDSSASSVSSDSSISSVSSASSKAPKAPTPNPNPNPTPTPVPQPPTPSLRPAAPEPEPVPTPAPIPTPIPTPVPTPASSVSSIPSVPSSESSVSSASSESSKAPTTPTPSPSPSPSPVPTPNPQPPTPTPAPSFPPFTRSLHPVPSVPDWGAMRTPAEWNRSYTEMKDEDFVAIPRYNMSLLTKPMKELTNPITEDTIPVITAKLYYSTRHFGHYDLDSGEYEWEHPGIDLKLALGTPIGVIGGGRVHAVRSDDRLGNHVIVEHRIGDERYFSVYGHLDVIRVTVGQDMEPGQMIGTVGMTGNTSGPHLHLQVDRGNWNETSHIPYWPAGTPSAAEAARHTVHPIEFLANNRKRD